MDGPRISDFPASVQQSGLGEALNRRRERALDEFADVLARVLGALEFEAVRSIRIAVDDVTRQDDPGIPSNVVYTKAEALNRVFQEQGWPIKRALRALREAR